MVEQDAIEEVLGFWFADEQRAWKKDPAFDEEIRQRFGSLYEAVERGDHEPWKDAARGSLAYVIVLDQFPRNMFRDTPRMYAGDDKALAAVQSGMVKGFDRELTKAEKGFYYLPLMHAESLGAQDRCVELFRDLGSQVEYAIRHRDIIQRFGRFPHRNAVLGRLSTPEEEAFLREPNSSF